MVGLHDVMGLHEVSATAENKSCSTGYSRMTGENYKSVTYNQELTGCEFILKPNGETPAENVQRN